MYNPEEPHNEIVTTNEKEVTALINEQEDDDFNIYRTFINNKNKSIKLYQTDTLCPIDVLQLNTDKLNLSGIELKQRKRYSIDDFDTISLSLRKVKTIYHYLQDNPNDISKIYLVCIYNKDNKLTINDLTDITTNKQSYYDLMLNKHPVYKKTRKKASKNQTRNNNDKEYQDFVEIPLSLSKVYDLNTCQLCK